MNLYLFSVQYWDKERGNVEITVASLNFNEVLRFVEKLPNFVETISVQNTRKIVRVA